MQPFNSGNQLDDFQFFDLVVEPANLRFLQFNPAPFCRIRVGQRLDNLHNLRACSHSLLLQLKKSVLCRGAGLIRILEYTVLPTADASAADVTVSAPATFLGGRARCANLYVAAGLAKASKHLRNYITDQSFINGTHCLAL